MTSCNSGNVPTYVAMEMRSHCSLHTMQHVQSSNREHFESLQNHQLHTLRAKKLKHLYTY